MNEMSFARHVLHPVGWLAGFRAAALGPGLLLTGAAAVLLLMDHQPALLALGLALAVAAVMSGVALAYAAASADRRRNPPSSRTSTAHQLRGDDVLAIIEHIDTKVDGLEVKLLTVIREGREAHTEEHHQQQLVCAQSMTPLQSFVSAAEQARHDRDARVRPLVRVAEWATNHWVVTLGIVTAILALLVKIGVVQ